MKKIKPHYPRRRELLDTPFAPLSDDAFRGLVASGAAIPARQGTTLLVAKWRDGPGLDADAFLTSLHAEGSTLEAREFGPDVNVRVVRGLPPSTSTGAVSRVPKARS
jgi:hypothetical protein